MRFIAIILITYISLLTASPAVCGLYETIKQVDLCCSSDSNKKCSNEPSGSKTQKQKDNSESDAPYAPCCSVQNCQCYFVTAPQLDFGIQLVTKEMRYYRVLSGRRSVIYRVCIPRRRGRYNLRVRVQNDTYPCSGHVPLQVGIV